MTNKMQKFTLRLAVITAACFAASWLAASLSGINQVHAYPKSLAKAYAHAKFGTGKVVLARKFSGQGLEELLIESTSTDVTLERSADGFVDVSLIGNYPATQDPLQSELAGNSLALRTVEANLNGNGFRFNINFDGAEGGLRVKVPAGVKRVMVKTVSGDMFVASLELEKLAVKTTSGRLHLEKSRAGELAFKSTSGDLKSDQTDIAKLIAESVSGDFEVQFQGDGPRVEAKTVSGDIELSVPGKPNLKVEFSSVSGELKVDGEGSRELRGGSTSIKLGEGKGQVAAKTVSGDLKIREL